MRKLKSTTVCGFSCARDMDDINFKQEGFILALSF